MDQILVWLGVQPCLRQGQLDLFENYCGDCDSTADSFDYGTHCTIRARQIRVRAYARTRKCKNNRGPYGFVKLEVRGRTRYSLYPRTPNIS